ncbi:MAG: ferredoxin oxidoreductase [Clostridia bacterium]|nr:ferredoxin oxidoreductase [Clostridia bacterium]MDQ7792631.1 ferredoxin oxidoreductase [Clostridia bacterium]
MEKVVTGEKRVFMTGNEVVCRAALAAGAEIMYGYPITPQNEIMHYWTRLAPRFGRRFLQTEDELSAGFATLGGVLAGRKAFTATAGPGNVLMQEPLAMAEMMRLPVVSIVVQRGGPSTATVIYSQQEVTLTTFGGNGEGLRFVYSTASHQELYDYTIKAFNLAWRYRFPVFVLADGYQGKMREPLTIYDPESRGIHMEETDAYLGRHGIPGLDRPPGHFRNTYNTEEELYAVMQGHIAAFEQAAEEVSEYETEPADGGLLITGHGIVARAVQQAVVQLRSAGFPVGYFRPITLRPLPVGALRDTAARHRQILVVESAYGQLGRLLRDAIYGCPAEVHALCKPGMGVTAEEIAVRAKQLCAARED